MYESVIVPLDRTPGAEAALPGALTFARQAEAKILLLSVLEVPDGFVNWARRPGSDAWLSKQKRDVHTYLDDIAARLDYTDVETRVAAGDPVCLIHQEIDQTREPLLIMARRPRSSMREPFSRGLTIRIARHVTCPLVVVTADDSTGSSQNFAASSVLVALDGSRHAERVLPAISGEVLNPDGLQLHLLRVIDTAAWHSSSQAIMYAYDFDRYVSDMCSIASRYLAKIHDLLAPVAARVSFTVRAGRVAEEICLAADEASADLIVVSTHGRSGIEHFLLGSVAEGVVTEAHRPVLLIRAAA